MIKDRPRDLTSGEEVVRQQDKAVALAFIGPNGQDALKVLKQLFFDRPDYVRGDTHHTAFQAGQRDVIGYIQQCMEGGDEVS